MATAFSSFLCNATNFLRCKAEVPTYAPDRIITTNADGFHCASNRIGPYIAGCSMSRMSDDSINVDTNGQDIYFTDGNVIDANPSPIFGSGSGLLIVNPDTGRVKAIAEVSTRENVPWHKLRAWRMKLREPLPATIKLPR